MKPEGQELLAAAHLVPVCQQGLRGHAGGVQSTHLAIPLGIEAAAANITYHKWHRTHEMS